MENKESYSFIIFDVSKQEPEKPYSKYPLKEYEVWLGSFLCQGMEGVAQEPFLIGKHVGRNFQDACMRLSMKNELENRAKYDKENTYFDTKRWDYNPHNNTDWANLFESKEAAFEDYNKNWK